MGEADSSHEPSELASGSHPRPAPEPPPPALEEERVETDHSATGAPELVDVFAYARRVAMAQLGRDVPGGLATPHADLLAAEVARRWAARSSKVDEPVHDSQAYWRRWVVAAVRLEVRDLARRSTPASADDLRIAATGRIDSGAAAKRVARAYVLSRLGFTSRLLGLRFGARFSSLGSDPQSLYDRALHASGQVQGEAFLQLLATGLWPDLPDLGEDPAPALEVARALNPIGFQATATLLRGVVDGDPVGRTVVWTTEAVSQRQLPLPPTGSAEEDTAPAEEGQEDAVMEARFAGLLVAADLALESARAARSAMDDLLAELSGTELKAG